MKMFTQRFTPSRIVNARGNVTLPLESPPEGGDLNRQRCRKTLKNNLAALEQRIRKRPGDQALKNQRAETQKEMQRVTKMKTSTHKKMTDAYKYSYCNPGCKATLLEPGSMISNSYKKRYPDFFPEKDDKAISLSRDTIFGTRHNVLVDDYYEGLTPRQVAIMKRAGAISGCTTTFVPSDF